MPISEQATRVLTDVFGFDTFRPGQAEIVDLLLNGKNLLAVMPTGAGKSLCYQLPSIVADCITVIVSPLVALIDDQVAALEANGVAAVRIHSGRSREDNVADWRKLAAGEAKIIYMSPERLMSERMLDALQTLRPRMFIIDEAHCISKWGTSFRPDYAALERLKHRFPDAAIAGFTATADKATQRDIADQLFSQNGEIIVQGFDRPNIWLEVQPKTNWRKQLLAFLETRKGQSGIVYCLSRRLVEEVAEFLNEQGIRALPYHAGMASDVRKENQEAFMAEEAVVMAATIAFGTGIDKSDIRFVFHLNLPGSMEAYYQEIGRAGRDGAPAEAFMLFGLDDVRSRRQFIENDASDSEHKWRENKRLDSLMAYCEATQCRRVLLLSYFNEDSAPCGNCDVCRNPPALINGTNEARMLFSAMVRTGERFGASHLIDILRGNRTEKIASLSHDTLPTFGVGTSHPKAFWSGFIRQAVAGGYTIIDIERFGGLRLSERGRAVLDQNEEFHYQETKSSRSSEKPSRAASPAAQALPDSDLHLFNQLKALRRELASERNVPAFVIFSDQTLRDMCGIKPVTLEQMSSVRGVGPKKLAELGEVFVRAIQQHA